MFSSPLFTHNFIFNPRHGKKQSARAWSFALISGIVTFLSGSSKCSSCLKGFAFKSKVVIDKLIFILGLFKKYVDGALVHLKVISLKLAYYLKLTRYAHTKGRKVQAMVNILLFSDKLCLLSIWTILYRFMACTFHWWDGLRQQGINILGALRAPCGCATLLVFVILLHIVFKTDIYIFE